MRSTAISYTIIAGVEMAEFDKAIFLQQEPFYAQETTVLRKKKSLII
jgi:hypothetical protein